MSAAESTTTPDLSSLSLGGGDSISSIISNIKSTVEPRHLTSEKRFIVSPFPIYISGLDIYRNYVYIEAEIRPECLDQGSEPTELVINYVRAEGIYEDLPAQYISKELGGDGHNRNVFPLYKDTDTAKWKNDQALVYMHIKKEDKNWAKLFYGITYNKETKLTRPKKIYYKYELYSNDDVMSNSIEGTFENFLPDSYKKWFKEQQSCNP